MGEVVHLLFVGDVVGPAGRAAAQAFIPSLRRELQLDAVICNAENSADSGFGVTPETAEALLSVADYLTLGDHAFDQDGIGAFLDREPRIIRPANFEAEVSGRGWGTFAAGGVRVGVANLLGRFAMRPAVRSPYEAADKIVEKLRMAGANLIVVDLQAEATSEKQVMGWHLAGRVTAVLGTHTHVPTADARILPGGTAYMTDVGMTGAGDGIIGFSRESLARAMVTGERAYPPRPAEGPVRLDAVLIEADGETGRALAIERVAREG